MSSRMHFPQNKNNTENVIALALYNEKHRSYTSLNNDRKGKTVYV